MPTSNGLSYSMNSLPRIACTIGAFRDRKSTRLNSSHSQISYAVFCLKKKKKLNTHHLYTQQKDPKSLTSASWNTNNSSDAIAHTALSNRGSRLPDMSASGRPTKRQRSIH